MKLSVALWWLAAACSGSSSSPKAPAEKPGRAERLQIGNLEAYALEDGPMPFPALPCQSNGLSTRNRAPSVVAGWVRE